jgi:hypothetical protein
MAAMAGRPKPLPKVPDPSHLEEHGVSIPAPTPTSINIPNPWKPASSNGDGRPDSQVGQATAPDARSGER